MQRMKQKKLKMKKNNNKFKGFTLAEVLMALSIIGILMALALTTIKPAQKSAMRYLYISAYNAVSQSYYNAMLSGNEFNPFSQADPSEEHSEENDAGAERLCKGLTSYINTMSNERTDDGDFATTCSSTKITSQLADEFLDEKVQFVATNGMKFYISNLITGPDDLKFYLVFVDLNGNAKPNSFVYTYKGGKTEDDYDTSDPDDLEQMEKDRIEPDIYAFVLLWTGRILPIGIPEYDKNILTARFIYYDNQNEMQHTNKSLAYYQAKGAAWGYYNNSGADPQPTDYNPDEPFSMNDVIRNAIDSESNIVKDFPNLRQLDPLAIEKNAPYHCSNQDLESCYVFLDEYKM